MALDPKLHGQPGLSPLNKAVVALIVLSILLAILETEPTFSQGRERFFSGLEMAFLAIFIAEYAARIWVSVENPENDGRLHYALTPASIIDLVTILAIGFTLVGFEGFLLRLARLMRLVRLARLGRFSQALQTLGRAIANRRHELMMSFALVVPLLLISSALLYFAEAEAQPAAFGSIPRAMWWSIATLTTVGYGDVVPITALGRIAAAASALAGIGLVAMPAGIIAAAMSEVIQENRRATEDAGTSQAPSDQGSS